MIRSWATGFIIVLGLSISCGDYYAAPTAMASEGAARQPQGSPADFAMLSKAGLGWFYKVELEIGKEGLPCRRAGRRTQTLTITNEGETLFEAENTTRLSWSYAEQGVSPRCLIHLYLRSSPEAVLLVGSEVREWSPPEKKWSTHSRETYRPPVPVLKEPLTEGSGWNYVGTRIQEGVRDEKYTVTYEVVKRAQISTSAGQSDAIKVIRREASGGTVEWWAKGIGLIKREEISSSHRSLAEMVRSTIWGKPIVTVTVPESRIEWVDEATRNAEEWRKLEEWREEWRKAQEKRTAEEKLKELLEYRGLRPGLRRSMIANRLAGSERMSTVYEPIFRDDHGRSVKVWPVSSVSKSGPSLTVFYATDGTGIWVHGTEMDGKYQAAKSRQFDLKHPLQPGSKWETGEILARENVVVPRGEFRDCLKVRTGTTGWMTRLTWYCKGVGSVKSHDVFSFPGSQALFELVDFTPAFPDVVVVKGRPLPELPPVLAFLVTHKVDEGVRCEVLKTNPFAYEGKTLAVADKLELYQMLERDKGVFIVGGMSMCGVVVSGIPSGTFSTSNVPVLLAGRVIGTTTAPSAIGVQMVPHLKFVGVHICREANCWE